MVNRILIAQYKNMKKVFLVHAIALAACLMCSLGTMAQEAYATFTQADSTLAFYYDQQRSTRPDSTYSLDVVDSVPGWYENSGKVCRVVFDTTFVEAHPTSTKAWFRDMEKLTSLSGIKYLNTDLVTDMSRMFMGCRSLTSLDLSNFNTGNVTNLMCMFQYCSQLTSLDLSSFNTENVTDMEGMFSDCRSLTSLDLSGFSTSKLTNMGFMFAYCTQLASLNMSGFNTSRVTYMRGLFAYCTQLTGLDLSAFDTQAVTDMNGMFAGCGLLTSLDLSAFNTQAVNDMSIMFAGCDLLETIYAGTAWTADSVAQSVEMFLGCTHLVGDQGTAYDENHVDAARAHIDGGSSNPGYLSAKLGPVVAYAMLAADSTALTFYYDGRQLYRQGTVCMLDTVDVDFGWSDVAGEIIQVAFDTTFIDARPTSTRNWFSNMSNLVSISDINYLNTSLVTDMRRMFAGCTSLPALDLSGFNTSSVTNMWAMFYGCGSLTSLDLSGFNTSGVTNMARMFSGCSSLTSLDLLEFNTSSVTDMAGMFSGCRLLKALDLSRFNISRVKYMGWMFEGCKSLSSLDLSSFNTSRVSEMEYMFQGCESLTSLDLSRFRTSSVLNMEAMFNGCARLETVDASSYWRTGAVVESQDMFLGCTHLVGGQGTPYDENHVDVSRARIDGGPADPGYFTGKSVALDGDVNADGKVNIADVNCVIGVILGDMDTYEGRADVNADGNVTISDLNVIINLILAGN